MDTEHDYLIVGAGPAGLQLGYFMQRMRRDYLILESSDAVGAFFTTFPRHRRLLSINKVHTGYDDPEVNLRWDWNSLLSDGGPLFRQYTQRYFPDAEDMTRYLGDYATKFALRVRLDCRIVGIDRVDGLFRLRTADGGGFACRTLVMATGVSQPYVPKIRGIELAENYVDMSVDPADFAGARVLIVGKGNSAFETAENLVETAALIHLASPHSITQAWTSHYPGHLRAVNNNVLETYRLKGQNALLDGEVIQIARDGSGGYLVEFDYAHAEGEREVLRYDRVLCCTGFRFDASMFEQSCAPEMAIDGRFPAQTPAWESTNVPGLYFAGTIMQTRDHKKAASPFIHGFRYNIGTLHRILEARNHHVPWAYTEFPATAEDVTRAVIERVNTSSALWQQFGFLCDVIVVSEDSGRARLYRELAVDFVRDCAFTTEDHYYVVTLEYGHSQPGDPFEYLRTHRENVDRASDSQFLHPIVRQYRGTTLRHEHHIIEDLAAEWREDEHVRPLLDFLSVRLPRKEEASVSL